jgi:hypothetical protein
MALFSISRGGSHAAGLRSGNFPTKSNYSMKLGDHPLADTVSDRWLTLSFGNSVKSWLARQGALGYNHLGSLCSRIFHLTGVWPEKA